MFSFMLAVSLLTAAGAFKFQSDESVNYSDFFDKRCVKALTTEINCDEHIRMFGQSRTAGWLGSNTTVDSVCITTCFDSFQQWNKTVTEECDKDLNRAFPPRELENIIKVANEMRQMWNATCIRDTKTGRYCFDVIDELRDHRTYGEGKTFKEPCHPCYGMVINAMLNASIEMELWGFDDNYWKEQLDLVHEKCGGPGKIEKDFEEQKVYNVSHGREPEVRENKGAMAMINQINAVWIAVVIYGWSMFIF
ncbi:hypothetical protein FPOA_00052 [Fusarium poae]|uniref:Uncharacterized protein n=1 Tax=Fusarium poae TaxID=36050 RepID=A0A1B8B047_FUSPO|nr:hypothetical protein FPOA_00052 [Fusarium poae]